VDDQFALVDSELVVQRSRNAECSGIKWSKAGRIGPAGASAAGDGDRDRRPPRPSL